MKIRNIKKVLYIFLFAGLIFNIPVFVFAESDSFNFYDVYDINPSSGTYFYSDMYFKEKSTSYNSHLSTNSLAFALTTFNNTCDFTRNVLSNNNFTNIDCDEIKPSKDTIGSVISSKKIDDFYLISVVIKSGRYEKEWESNFNSGASGDIEGFKKASEKVLDRIKKYIEKNNLSNYKIWITGYSRGASVANLVGKYINEGNDLNIKEEDLFVYTFESAKASSSNKKYNNIYNIVNNNDLVTKLYPDSFKMYNSGTIIDITKEKKIMLKRINIMKANVSDYKEVNLDSYLSDLISSLFKNIEREEYNDKYKNLFIKVMDNYFDDTDYFKILDDLYRNSFSIITSSSKKIAFDLLKGDVDSFLDTIKDEMLKYVNSSLKTSEEVKTDLEIFFSFAKKVLKNDIKENALKMGDDTLNLSRILTFIYNAKDIILEHSGSNTFNLLKEKDSFYSGCSIEKEKLKAYKNESLKVKVNDCKYLVKNIYIDGNILNLNDYILDDEIEIKLSDLEAGNHKLEIDFGISKDSISFDIFNKKNTVSYIYIVSIITTITILLALYFYDKKVKK